MHPSYHCSNKWLLYFIEVQDARWITLVYFLLKLEIPCSFSLYAAAISLCSAKFFPIDLYHAKDLSLDPPIPSSILPPTTTFFLAAWQTGSLCI